MTKLITEVQKPTNGKSKQEENAAVVAAKEIINSPNPEQKKDEIVPALEVKKEMTLMEKIMKVENLGLVIEKRSKLVQTRSELDRFQITSNDFNCSMRLNDSDGNVFTTSFTPGIKKVIDFLKASFDASIEDVEKKINF